VRDSSRNTMGLFLGRWWTVLLRGVAAVAFGVLVFVWPHLTVATLVLLFGFYALTHGLSSMIAAIFNRQKTRNRWLLAFEGVIGIWAGMVTLRAPSTTAMVLIFFVWAWAMATGILRIVEAIRLRKEISGEIWLALSGVVLILFGFMLRLRPVMAVIDLAWVIAACALLFGLFEIMLGRELRSVQHAGA
jgi:uncharacterized membrane protein HdeD (DUF308 family)